MYVSSYDHWFQVASGNSEVGDTPDIQMAVHDLAVGLDERLDAIERRISAPEPRNGQGGSNQSP
jgi:hypothetical protein